MTNSAWVRVVIVNYNGGLWLQQTVDALSVQTCANFEAVIVDNASSDDSLKSLRLPDSRFSVLEAGGNIGFAAGCNLGASGATTPWLAMLNPDALAAPDWLCRLKEATKRYPGAASFGSTQLMHEDPVKLDGGGDNYSIYGIAWRGGYGDAVFSDRDRRVMSACAAASLYRRDVFEAMGGFETSFFCYLEDVDLGFRIRLAGYDVIQVADAVVRHVGSTSTGRASPFTLRHSARNGIWLMLRCLPLPLLVFALPLHLMAIHILMGRSPEQVEARMSGLREAFKNPGLAWRQGRRIQAQRQVGLLTIARWLAWNPRNVARRRVMDLPPISLPPGRISDEVAGGMPKD